MKLHRKLTMTLLFILVTVICAQAADKLSVYTVNYPLAYFAERIGSDQVEVVFPAPADVDPAYWMPDKQTIAAYQNADLILLNGANYAKWVSKVSLPRGKMVDTSRKFKSRYVYASDVTTHSHGAGGAHAHESLAFTTWLDLSLAKLQAEAVYNALARKRPGAKLSFRENYQALEAELDRMDQQIRDMVAKQPKRPLLGSHPVYDYLAAGYGLNLKSVHWEPAEEPSYMQWQELQKVLVDHKAEVMLWEGTPMAQTEATLKSMGVESIVFDPCGNRSVNGDFLEIMQRNVENLAKIYK